MERNSDNLGRNSSEQVYYLIGGKYGEYTRKKHYDRNRRESYLKAVEKSLKSYLVSDKILSQIGDSK